jgi:hypothetical protein
MTSRTIRDYSQIVVIRGAAISTFSQAGNSRVGDQIGDRGATSRGGTRWKR